ncbi:SAM-dependent methyltransferase [Niveibacterium sp. SC-1]|uniref:class I SAM-dependent methyltransferase n=1 Tax=Niveibacterium sp. SC-1 TaxID=3135646 RepID=UPI00311DF87A
MPGYLTKFERVPIAGDADMQIRSLLDRNQYSDPLGEAAAAGISPATWPLFGILWPSAQKLADLMQGWDIDGLRVLEIGCGLGLSSLVLQRRLGDITASDCHPLAEAFLQANLLLNDLPAIKYVVGNWGRVNPGLGEFDLLIGSDLLYEPDHPAQLAGFIALHAAPRADVLIVDPNRGNRSAFHREMALAGFALTETLINAPLSDGQPYSGRLLHYRR